MTAHFLDERYQNSTDEWATPPEIIQPLADAVGGFDLDPASGAEHQPHAETTYTKEDDGLHQPWYGTVWCNPPYSEKLDWLVKARDEIRQPRCDTIVMLLPVDTSTQWFHTHATAADLLCFHEGRIKFGDSDSTASFSSMYVVYGEVSEDLLHVFDRFGTIFRAPWERFDQQTLTDVTRSAAATND